MTLAEAGEIFRYWEDSPPPHLMLQIVARMLGWKPPERAPPASPAELAAAAPPGLAVAPQGGLGMPEPVFELDTLRRRNRARARDQA